MIYFGGGAPCFTEEMCSGYRPSVGKALSGLRQDGGLFDLGHSENPVADYSAVYVPQCTGDLHLGDARTEYSPDVIIEHRGAVNARAAVDRVVERFPDATDIVVGGSSGGAPVTPIVGALLADRLPDARIVTLGDSAGAYPDVPDVNELLNERWGTFEARPDWPVNEGLTAADWGFASLYSQAGLHAPDVILARFDYAYDEAQANYAALAGIDAADLVEQIDATETQIEAAGVALSTYVAPGAWHGVAKVEWLYEVEVDGVRLIDWVSELVAGSAPDDVHCVACHDG
jgi:hypothetical protein